MATAGVGDAMEVVWVDADTKRAGGTLHLSPSDLRSLDTMTVYELKQVLAKKLRLTPSTKLDLKLYGHCIPSGRAAAYLPFLRANAPRFALAFTKRDAPLTLFVKSMSGRTVCLEVYPHETIGQVKAMLEDKEGIPAASQRLVYGGVDLADRHAICRYNIRPHATLHGLARLVGGSVMRGVSCSAAAPRTGGAVKFADVGNAAMMEVVGFSTGAPVWCRVGHGLNLLGRCENRACDAFEQRVYIPLGFRPFNLMQQTSHCPACDASVTPTSCGFYNCLWRYEGTKAESGVHVSSGWVAANGEKLYQYKSDGGSLVSWESLVVVAQNLVIKECAVCFEALGGSAATTLCCNHRIHSFCLTQWTHSCQNRHASVTCPLCRARVS